MPGSPMFPAVSRNNKNVSHSGFREVYTAANIPKASMKAADGTETNVVETWKGGAACWVPDTPPDRGGDPGMAALHSEPRDGPSALQKGGFSGRSRKARRQGARHAGKTREGSEWLKCGGRKQPGKVFWAHLQVALPLRDWSISI